MIGRHGWPIVAVIALGAALRMIYVVYLPGQGKDLVHSDMNAYDVSAWAMVQAQPISGEPGFNGYHPLSASTYYYAGYTYFVALIYAIFGHDLAALRFIQGIVSSLTLWLVYLIGLRVFDRLAAFIATGLVAASLPLVYYAGLALTETWFLFLECSALLATLAAWGAKARDQNAKQTMPNVPIGFVSGLLIGLASITRPGFLPAAPLLAIGPALFLRLPHLRGKRVAIAAAILVGAACPIAPVAFRNLQIHGRLILVSTNGPATFFISHVAHIPNLPQQLLPRANMTDLEIADWCRAESAEYLSENWGTYLAEVPELFLMTFYTFYYWPESTIYYAYEVGSYADQPARVLIIPHEAAAPRFPTVAYFPDFMRAVDIVVWGIIAVPMGILACFRLPRPRYWILVMFALFPSFIIPFIALPMPRYRMPAVPLVMLLAGHALALLANSRISDATNENGRRSTSMEIAVE